MRPPAIVNFCTIYQDFFLGYIENKACYAVVLTQSSPILADTQLNPMRAFLGSLPDNLFTICSRSLQLIDWFKHHQFCGICGKKMNIHQAERAMTCSCNTNLIYPRISPCIIVLVTKGDDLLLAHNKNFPGKFYSTLAGFIEAGETSEEAIHREIEEEVNIKVKKVPHPEIEKEVVRVMKMLPKMKPARQRDIAIGVSYSLPLTFIVEENLKKNN